MQFGSGVAVALVQASGYGSDYTPSLGTSICCRSSPRKGKKTKKKKEKRKKKFTRRTLRGVTEFAGDREELVWKIFYMRL